jgi:hypothetical protein
MFGRGARNLAIEHGSRRLPLLRRVPVVRLILIAELAIVAWRHFQNLTPAERRRLFALLRRGRRLTPKQKKELRNLVAKLEPRAFAGSAADRLSPVPLPRRLTKAKY